jgi:mannose-1-phosphate guanylyltransferase
MDAPRTGRPPRERTGGQLGGHERVALLAAALRRARAVAGEGRVRVLLSADAQRWSADARAAASAATPIAQPAPRGSANGILLALLTVLAADPAAVLLLLPANQVVADEDRIVAAASSAVRAASCTPDRLFVVGVSPDAFEESFSYVLPRPGATWPLRVDAFFSCPTERGAARLVGRGALWNSSIVAARGTTLLELFAERVPEIVEALASSLSRAAGAASLEAVFRLLPPVDFWKDVLAGAEDRTGVVAAGPCGWAVGVREGAWSTACAVRGQ